MTKCEVCGKEKGEKYKDILGSSLPKDQPKWWCDECINKALYWGLERYTEAVK